MAILLKRLAVVVTTCSVFVNSSVVNTVVDSICSVLWLIMMRRLGA